MYFCLKGRDTEMERVTEGKRRQIDSIHWFTPPTPGNGTDGRQPPGISSGSPTRMQWYKDLGYDLMFHQVC